MKVVYTAENDLDDLPVLIAAWEGLDRESFKSLVYDYIRDESIPNPDRSISRLALCEWNIHMFLEGTTGSFREANYLDLCWTYPGEWIELKPGQREPNPFGSSSPLVTESDLDAYPLGDPKRIALERELGRGLTVRDGGAYTNRLRDITDPVGSWWAAFDNGEVWPVEIISANMFGTRVRATHEAAPEGEHLLAPSRVYDSDFNRPRWGSANPARAGR